MSAIVRTSGLLAGFGSGPPVLAGVDLEVRAGEVVALVGANGAGKSTLLRALIGMVPARSGEVVVDGVRVPGASRGELRALRSRVGFAFQRFCLAGRLSVLHNTLHGALGRSGPRGWWPALAAEAEREWALACLDRVGLAHLAQRRLSTLSGGQQQRVALARALMQRPRLLLADEPVASLDPAAATNVMGILRDIAVDERLTVIVALHQLDYARQFADRIVGLSGGRVALDEPAWECAEPRLQLLYGAPA
ncbi:MAG TPA: phosphonate ABC transporter ATP-binding protein [Solirubrobacteraceae bacterium]|nr:phosphonate ABC transporter ATP-binding protein [Solirubrobacteraceae bacterium]